MLLPKLRPAETGKKRERPLPRNSATVSVRTDGPKPSYRRMFFRHTRLSGIASRLPIGISCRIWSIIPSVTGFPSFAPDSRWRYPSGRRSILAHTLSAVGFWFPARPGTRPACVRPRPFCRVAKRNIPPPLGESIGFVRPHRPVPARQGLRNCSHRIRCVCFRKLRNQRE